MRWTSDILDSLRNVGDEPADTVIAEMVARSGASQVDVFFGQMIRNVSMPAASTPEHVQDFLTRHSQAPAGIDFARVLRGQQIFVDHCPKIALILYFKSLPMTYLNWRACRTLAITGRLDKNRKGHEIFARRVGETTQFVFDVMTPGNLVNGGVGVSTALKVRLIHASIRALVNSSSDFDRQKFQTPVCQEDLTYTLHTFALEMVEGLKQLNVRLSQQQAEDFFYAWKLIGHYLGIAPHAVPSDLADAQAQQDAMLGRLAGKSADGISITSALMEFSREAMIPGTWFDNTPEQLIRFFIGAADAETLGIPRSRNLLTRFIPLFIREWFGLEEKLEDQGHGLEQLSNLIGLELIKFMMRSFKSFKGRSLEVHGLILDHWGLRGVG